MIVALRYIGLKRQANYSSAEGYKFAANVNANNENLNYGMNGKITTLVRY